MDTRFRFTKSKLHAIKPDPSKRLYFHDTETPGLGLTVTQKGSKSFFIKYGRAKAARRVALTRDDHSDDFPATSRFPELTVEQARKRAARVLLEKTQGTDPIQKKRQEDGSHRANRLQAESASISNCRSANSAI